MLYSDYEGSRLEFLKILIEQGEEPAFLRRSRELSETLGRMHNDLRHHRERLLKEPRVALKQLAIRIGGDWSQLGKYLRDPDDYRFYQRCYDQLQPGDEAAQLTSIVDWFRGIRSRLVSVHRAVKRFNERWTRHLDRVDLESLNAVLRDYNRYYPMEKTCAFGVEDIQRLGFNPAQPITPGELESEYPLIVLPQLRGESS